jgi:gliding motility-associated protein GldM
MGHGKETPRQKMIGMMYLVLTALLALNVSADILNAFIIVDKSLNKTISNFIKKNDVVYNGFEKAFKENQAKTKPWYDKAQIVKLESQKLIDSIRDDKKRIVMIADKVPESEWSDSLFFKVKSKDNNNVPGQVMILEKRGESLKEMLDAYREKMVSLIKDTAKASELIAGIRSNLMTEKVYSEQNKEWVPWEDAYFNHLPLIAVITILSKLQTDIKNSEADMLNYLYGNIDAASYKFNKLEAIVKPNSSYVLQNNKYEAEIFIAASDTTVKPDIYVGGQKLADIKEGKGLYTGSTSTLGVKKWGGEIKYKAPTGEILVYPFSTEYQVGAPSFVVSPTKMNVFYIGVDNPVDITASGVPEDKLQASISSGSLVKKAGSSYIVRVTKPGEVTITGSAEVDKKRIDFGAPKKFRVKTVPDPIAVVGANKLNWKGGMITKSALLAEQGVQAILENFDFDLKFNITGFTVSAIVAGGFEESQASTGTSFSVGQKNLMKNIQPGKRVNIEKIVAKGPDGTDRPLNTITFKIQ